MPMTTRRRVAAIVNIEGPAGRVGGARIGGGRRRIIRRGMQPPLRGRLPLHLPRMRSMMLRHLLPRHHLHRRSRLLLHLHLHLRLHLRLLPQRLLLPVTWMWMMEAPTRRHRRRTGLAVVVEVAVLVLVRAGVIRVGAAGVHPVLFKASAEWEHSLRMVPSSMPALHIERRARERGFACPVSLNDWRGG